MSGLPCILHTQGADERGPASHGQWLIIRVEPMVVSKGRKGWGAQSSVESPAARAFASPEQGKRCSRFGEAKGKRW